MRYVLVAFVLALAGCSNLSPAGNAIVGAAVGVAVVEHANQHRQYHPHPNVYVTPYPRYCFPRPVRWNPYTGQPVAYVTECR